MSEIVRQGGVWIALVAIGFVIILRRSEQAAAAEVIKHDPASF